MNLKQLKFRNFFLILFIIFLIWIIYWMLIIYTGFLKPDWAIRGQFGDMFGAINALFAGFAFGGVIYTIFLQMKELEYQREELKLTRDEIKGQKEQMILQNFELSFFNLLRSYTEYRDKVNQRGDILRQQFATDYNNAFRIIIHKNKDKIPDIEKLIKMSVQQYLKGYPEYKFLLRHLENILTFISGSEVENKYFYFNLVKTFLNREENGLLFYYSIYKKDESNIFKILKEINFFDDLNDFLYDPKHGELYFVST